MKNFVYGLVLGGGGGLITGLIVWYILAPVMGVNTFAGQVMLGVILGGLMGALVSAVVGGDPDAHADSTAAQGIWGFFFGAVAGALGSSQFKIIDWIVMHLR